MAQFKLLLIQQATLLIKVLSEIVVECQTWLIAAKNCRIGGELVIRPGH